MKKLSILILISLSIINSKASHMIAGEINYECLGNNIYEITLTVYRDCSGITFGTNATVSISSSCNGAQSLTLQGVDLSPNDPTTIAVHDTGYLCNDYLGGGQTTCTGGQYPGVHIYQYVGTITLSPCSDWLVSYASCCRPGTYNYPPNNACGQPIQGAGTVGTMRHNGGNQYLDASLDNSDGNCNSSPTFKLSPRAFVCQGQPIYFDNGATDPDGDSLVFELTSPLENASTGINYNSGYSFDHPIDLVGGGNFNINPNTGLTIITPFDHGKICSDQDSLEQSSTAVKVSQYRNGNMVGHILRDVQIVTLPGCSSSQPVSLGIQTISPQSGYLNDSTVAVCVGDSLTFTVRMADFTSSDTIGGYSNVTSIINGSNFSFNYVTGPSDIMCTIKLYPDTGDVGTHTFKVVADNGGCPVSYEITDYFTAIISDTCSINSGINPPKVEDGQFNFHPNPTTSQLNFQFEGVQLDVQILDITGKVVMTKKLTSNNKSVALDLLSGIYLVRMQSEGINEVQKLIVE